MCLTTNLLQQVNDDGEEHTGEGVIARAGGLQEVEIQNEFGGM